MGSLDDVIGVVKLLFLEIPSGVAITYLKCQSPHQLRSLSLEHGGMIQKEIQLFSLRFLFT